MLALMLIKDGKTAMQCCCILFNFQGAILQFAVFTVTEGGKVWWIYWSLGVAC